MASYLDKARVSTAITSNTKLDLSHVHVTSANFMQMAPIYNKEMVPGEKISVSVETFARLNPMPVPTFGRANIRNRAFFVPFRTVFRGWNDFITDADHVASAGLGDSDAGTSGLISTVPTVSNDTLVNLFVLNSTSTTGNPAADHYALLNTDSSYGLGTWDIVVDASTTSITSPGGTPYRFTSLGRQVLKVIESLGYKINWNSGDTTVYSALPILCYAKVYADWYWNSQYINNSVYRQMQSLFNYDVSNAPKQLNTGELYAILTMSAFNQYDSDYFVSAWDNPVSPAAGNYSSFAVPDITTAGAGGQIISNAPGSGISAYNFVGAAYAWDFGVSNGLSTNGTPVTSMNYRGSAAGSPIGTNNIGVSVSDYQHKALSALTDYMKRHQLAGSRAMDRYLARYGKVLSAEKLNRSVYVGSQLVPLQIGDVMSNSDTTGAALGDYAGKGIAYGQSNNFEFSTDEFGMFIVISSIVPAIGYVQGIDRNVTHVNKLDFFTPEFDAMGCQPIRCDELYVDQFGNRLNFVNPSTGNSIHEQVFGFTPRYAEYKVGKDQLTGNFRVRTLNAADAYTGNIGSDSYHLFRNIDYSIYGGVSNLVHSPAFVESMDSTQYNRIFYYTRPDAPDQFVLIHNFNVASWSPMKALYDTYEFDDADKGKKVTLDVNGVKMN